jgi:hypothetical protein
MNSKDDRKNRAREEPKHEGDVLGISDAGGTATIPTARPAKSTPKGIEVRERATGIGDVPQRSGATGIDMGAGGEGTDVTTNPSRPKSSEPDEE